MAVDWAVVIDFAKPLAAGALGYLGKTWLERKPKLIMFYGSISTHEIRPEGEAAIRVHTHELVVRNVGKKPAKAVRISHHYLPNYYLSPSVPYTIEELPAGGKDIVLPAMVPGEQVLISYLYYPPVIAGQIHSGVKHEEGFASPKNVLLQPVVPKPLAAFLTVLVLIGAGFLAYLLVTAGVLVAGKLLGP